MSDQLAHALARESSVVLLGPRQVGKTTLARLLLSESGKDAIYLDLERPADRVRLTDPDLFLRRNDDRLVVLDEVQRVPELFPVLRGVIDERRFRGDRAGHALLLGSASFKLLRQSSESLAGRAVYLELHPFDALEVDDVARLWIYGGFPESYLAADAETGRLRRAAFLRTYLERDIPAFAPRLPTETISRLWTMLAHEQGATLNVQRLARSLEIATTSIHRYVDLLCDLLLVRRLPPWSANAGKRLVRTPKVYVRDSGLLHELLGLTTWDDVAAHPVAGFSWEGFVIENVIAVTESRYRAYFYRTADGAEIDLVLERGGAVDCAIEIKRSSAPSISKGFHLACEALQPRRKYLVHGGSGEPWPMKGEVEAITLPALMKILAA